MWSVIFFHAHCNNFHNADQRKTYFSKEYGWQGWMTGRINGRMDMWIDGRMDRWIDGSISAHC